MVCDPERYCQRSRLPRGALSPRIVDSQWIAKALGIGRAGVYRVL
jgi:hypothetical protein